MHVNSKTVRARSASDRHLMTKNYAVLALMTNCSALHLLLMLINWQTLKFAYSNRRYPGWPLPSTSF